MKKIPTLFKRVFDDEHKKSITEEVTPGCEWVLGDILGLFFDEFATVKYDGACCAIIDGELYKRYDAKQKYGKIPPEGAIPCQPEPDPITGHWPHWVKCNPENPTDKYFLGALDNKLQAMTRGVCGQIVPSLPDGTYEAIGPHWQSNPYHLTKDTLIRHGKAEIGWGELADDWGSVGFDSIKDYLSSHEIEGIVFWKDGEPNCKIKRSDFGFEWPIRKDGK